MKGIYNYLFWDEKLSSSGMPSLEQLKEIAEAGKQVVINLATEKSEGAISNEGELVSALGMLYIHIPVDWNNPTSENLYDFFAVMEAHREKNLFVHCQANYRATAFLALYHIHKRGWDKEDAIAVMNKMWNPEDFSVWGTFMDEHVARF